jgi:hypothetical protein
MNKRYFHHLLVQLHKVSAWVFVALVVASIAVSAVALRNNNAGSVDLRAQLLEVDKQNGDVETSLKQLREYTYSHMNSSLATENAPYPPIQLKYRYERLVSAEKARVSEANSKLATAAQNHCEALIPAGRSLNRIECIQNYMTTNGVKENSIPDSIYKFDFADPVWSPDLAGWSVLVSIVLSLVLLVRTSLILWLRHQLS